MESLLLPGHASRSHVPVTSIEYLEASGNYSLIHFNDQRPLLVAVTLKRFSERLPSFLRIHKSTLVNPAYIVDYHLKPTDDSFVSLPENRRLSVSRRQIKPLKPLLPELRAANSKVVSAPVPGSVLE